MPQKFYNFFLLLFFVIVKGPTLFGATSAADKEAEINQVIQELPDILDHLPDIEKITTEALAELKNMPPVDPRSTFEKLLDKPFFAFVNPRTDYTKREEVESDNPFEGIKLPNHNNQETNDNLAIDILTRPPDKPLWSREGPALQTVSIPGTIEDGTLKYDAKSAELHNVKLHMTGSIKGKHLLALSLLAAVWQTNHIMFKNRVIIDAESCALAFAKHKIALIRLLQDLKFTKDGSSSNHKVLEEFEKLMHEECILPSTKTYTDYIKPVVCYAITLETLSLAYDTITSYDSSNILNSIIKSAKSYKIREAFNQKKHKKIVDLYNDAKNNENYDSVPGYLVNFLCNTHFRNSFKNHNTMSLYNVMLPIPALNKLLLNITFPNTNVNKVLDSKWFYILKKTIMYLNFIRQSQNRYQKKIAMHCKTQSKKLLNLLCALPEKINTHDKTSYAELQDFIKMAQQETFLEWQKFKAESFATTTMYFNLASVIPAMPWIIKTAYNCLS